MSFTRVLISAAGIFLLFLSIQSGCGPSSEDSEKQIPKTPLIQTTSTAPAKLPEIVFTEEDNGKTTKLKVGDKAILILDENLTTPYRWKIEKRANKIIKLDSPGSIPPKDQMPGSGGQKTFPFTVIEKGTATLELKLWWPRKDGPSIGSFTLTIEVP